VRGASLPTYHAASLPLLPLLLRFTEEGAFLAQWTSIAEQVTHSFEQSLQGWATAAAATASFMGGAGAGRFPNVTFPGFAGFAEAQLTLCAGRALSFNPLLSAAQLAGWNAYAAPLAPSFGPGVNPLLSVYERDANGTIIPSLASRHFTVPVWQIAPWTGNAAAVFYDLHSQVDRQRALDTSLASRAVAVTDIITLVQDRAANVSRASGIVFAPVFDGGVGNASAPVVGWVSVVFSWDTFLSSALPEYVRAVDVVLKSVSSGRVFTFRLGQGTVTSLGAGDLHQAAGMDGLMVSTSATLGIQYDLSVYPTRELHDQYITTLRVQACAGAVLTIVLLTVVFALYDFAQRHRAVLVSRWAAVTGRIVGETFPKNVRARLYEHASAPRPAPPQSISDLSTRVSMVDAPDGERMHRWSVGTSMSSVNEGNATGLSVPGPSRLAEKLLRKAQALLPRSVSAPRVSRSSVSAAPIADHYENCTVLFGDLVQFTSWASQVPPERVFTVLEAVFAEFDDAARKNGVFKVETIGDCYMAVTGLPTPSATHAEQMANFALSLGPRLARACVSVGLEPDRLQVRVGLHSGAVTAGIVRADRSRYQLFGDTVNLASRMESTGEASRVQCSGATEALLRATHVLEPRGQVECKGKGMVETFYLTSSRSEDTCTPD